MVRDEENAFLALRRSLEAYAPISNETWCAYRAFCTFRLLSKGASLYDVGTLPKSYGYVYRGLIRCFVIDEKGTEYNKNFFDEGTFPGAMTALLTSTSSSMAFEAIEASMVIEIDFSAFRKLLVEKDDLKLFQIYYLERNWLLDKDAREIEMAQEDATARYLRFTTRKPELVERLAQYHIASHLGITATQLSRIRKKM